MGSCLSKKKQKAPSPCSAKRHFPQENPSRGRPPPVEEEETVKEVLPISETPKKTLPKIEPKRPFPIPENPNIPSPENEPNDHSYPVPETPETSFLEAVPNPPCPEAEEGEKEEKEVKIEEKIPTFVSADETSEYSEICSASETVSTATIAEKKGEVVESGCCDEVEMRPKGNRSPAKLQKKRSFSGDSPGRNERSAKSPARRSDPSLGRRAPMRDVGRKNRSRTPTGSNSSRRDTGERRSRSPATRKDLARSPSLRKTRSSPRRNPVEATQDSVRKVEGSAAAAAATESASKESLENPLVSLECFIFL